MAHPRTPTGGGSGLLSRLRPARGDDGVTLIELMMAMLIFGIAASGITAGFLTAMKTSRADQNRVAAANLAARELEIVRNDFRSGSDEVLAIASDSVVVNANPLPGGTAGNPLVVDGYPYTVTRTVQWLPAGSGVSACDGGAGVTYPSLAVQVEVTWPNMGAVDPVRSNTILTPPKGVLASGTSFIAVKVVGRDNQPIVGMPVTLKLSTTSVDGVTADDGCATMAVPSAGTWTANLSSPGYVDMYGTAAPSKSVTVTSGSLAQTTMTYDEASSLVVSYSTRSGYSLPSGLRSLTLSNALLQPNGVKVVSTSSATTTVSGLWPFNDGYTLWAGSCLQSDPAAAGGARDPAVVLDPGGSDTVSTSLAADSILVRTSTLLPVSGATVVAYPLDATGCASTENPLVLGVTSATGYLNTSLPAGNWTVQVSGRSPVGAWPTTGVLLPSAAPTSTVVTVS